MYALGSISLVCTSWHKATLRHQCGNWVEIDKSTLENKLALLIHTHNTCIQEILIWRNLPTDTLEYAGEVLALTFCKSVRWQHAKRCHSLLVKELLPQAEILEGPFYCSLLWTPEDQLRGMKFTKFQSLYSLCK